MNEHYLFFTPGILIYKESLNAMALLPPDELKELVVAINRMHVFGELEPKEMNPNYFNAYYTFECVRDRAKRDNEKFIEKRRITSMAGKEGAKARWGNNKSEP